MEKGVFDDSSIGCIITEDQTVNVINMLKKLPYVSLDIYGKILLTNEQQKKFDKIISNASSEFFLELYELKNPGISLYEIQIITGEYTPREHGIYLDAKVLTGREIVKTGFNSLYCRAKNLKVPETNAPYNVLEIKKESKNWGKNYRIDVYGVPYRFDFNLDKKQRAKKCRSDILSEIEKNKIY
ncbi:MAG: hypothetical protein Q8Q04_03440 [archaeon]|nr:hypothetical protein [archaeon]